jgi:hypothetical protein
LNNQGTKQQSQFRFVPWLLCCSKSPALWARAERAGHVNASRRLSDPAAGPAQTRQTWICHIEGDVFEFHAGDKWI